MGRGQSDVARLRARAAAAEVTPRSVQNHIQTVRLRHLLHDRVDVVGGEQVVLVHHGERFQERESAGHLCGQMGAAHSGRHQRALRSFHDYPFVHGALFESGGAAQVFHYHMGN